MEIAVAVKVQLKAALGCDVPHDLTKYPPLAKVLVTVAQSLSAGNLFTEASSASAKQI